MMKIIMPFNVLDVPENESRRGTEAKMATDLTIIEVEVKGKVIMSSGLR